VVAAPGVDTARVNPPDGAAAAPQRSVLACRPQPTHARWQVLHEYRLVTRPTGLAKYVRCSSSRSRVVVGSRQFPTWGAAASPVLSARETRRATPSSVGSMEAVPWIRRTIWQRSESAGAHIVVGV
jgi:hypothetical protein